MNDKEKEILKARAKALAKEATYEAEGERLDVVAFMLAHEEYAVESVFVREVCPLKDLTPVPCTPPFVAGVINVHGQIISVIDLKKFFDLPAKGITNLDRVIILHLDKMTFGILADEVLGRLFIPLAAIEPSLPTLTDVRADYLKGVTEDRIVILDGERILTDERMMVCEEIET